MSPLASGSPPRWTDGPALQPADAVPAEALHAALLAAFDGYVAGPVQVPLAQWPGFLQRQVVDLPASRAVQGGGAVQGFVLVSPRPAARRWRVALMAVRPEAQGSGVADALLDDLAQRAQSAGQQALELEVFAQNPRALRAYQRHGFEIRHALHGHLRAARQPWPVGWPWPTPELPEPGTLAVPADDALAWLAEAERHLSDLPLQVLAPVLAVTTVPWTAWRHGTAQLLFSTGPDGELLLRSLIDRDPTQGDAQTLVLALGLAHPRAALSVPALQRPDVGGQALQRLGFRHQPLHQWLMVRTL